MKRINFNRIAVAMLLATTMLNASVSLAAETDSTSSSSVSSEVESTKDSTQQTTETSNMSATDESTATTDSTETTNTGEMEERLEEPIMFKQTIHIQKVLSKEKITNGKDHEGYEGVNGAHFKVYDVTDVLKSVVVENGNKTALDKANIEKMTTEVIERSKKLSEDQLKLVTEGDTKEVNGRQGVFEFTIEVNLLSQNAYYIVNDSNPETATKSEDTGFIAPICDENGEPMADVWMFPKAEPITKNDPKKIVEKTLPSTGLESNWIEVMVRTIKGWFN